MAESESTSTNMSLMEQRKITLCPDDANVIFELNKLCDELVGEILVRLPTTSAAQFQLVCKKWYSLISSPSFIPRFLHIHHHKHRHVTTSIIFQYTTYNPDPWNQLHSDFQIISDGSFFRNLYGEGTFSLSYLSCPPQNLRLEASFQDLILCSYITRTRETDYYISNPINKQWITLPPTPAHDDFWHSVSIGFLCVPPSCSECTPLDRDNISRHKFMVVRLLTDDSDVPLSQFKVQISSSDDTKWRSFDVTSPIPLQPHKLATSLVEYKRMLHWLNGDSIVVYDPLNTPQTFSRIIHFPDTLRLQSQIDTCFGVSQGRLCVVRVSSIDQGRPRSRLEAWGLNAGLFDLSSGIVRGNSRSLEVWELEDYVSGLFNLVYKVPLQTLFYNGLPESELYSFSILCLHPENGDVIYLRTPHGVVILNMRTRVLQGFYPVKGISMSSLVKAFQLTDQWWPTSIW